MVEKKSRHLFLNLLMNGEREDVMGVGSCKFLKGVSY